MAKTKSKATPAPTMTAIGRLYAAKMRQSDGKYTIASVPVPKRDEVLYILSITKEATI